MRKFGYGLAVATAAMTASSASAAVLLSDDMSTNANWSVIGTADSAATFGFDYSTVGIPIAPGAANTLALKLEANNGDAITGAEQIAAVSNANFGGIYQVTLNFWANYTGPLEFGGAGSTEFIGAGIGHDGVSNAFDSGATVSFSGDAGSATDLRAYEDGTQQALADGGFNGLLTGLNHPNIGGEIGLFPATGAPAAQTALFPSQIEFTRAGSAGFAWREMVITVSGGRAKFEVDGVHVVTLDNSDGTGFSNSGSVGLLYRDLFSSVAGNPAVSFGLYTNVVVTDVPEPASLALMGLGGLMMLRRR
jgi:PEP-CTERM motif-containing protein